ncbi:hypothetical protein TIFTF001_003011 [Ficus carica]|uniref:Uncharacterized protein n=1 Tax=Ficus carica TaxID=3494 RepID=A0AA87Z7A6_FICCA|nr:hypothetical protein TIFTF001_003011 [Ficus carica]
MIVASCAIWYRSLVFASMPFSYHQKWDIFVFGCLDAVIELPLVCELGSNLTGFVSPGMVYPLAVTILLAKGRNSTPRG